MQNELNVLNERLDDLRGKKELLAQAEGRIPELKQQIARAQQDIWAAQREVPRATKELATRELEIEGLRQLKMPTEQDESELKVSFDALSQSQVELARKAAVIDATLKNYERIREDGICPTCGQKPTQLIAKKIADERAKRNKVQQQVDHTEKCLAETDALLGALKEYSRSLIKLTLLEQPANMLRQKIGSNEEKIETAQREITKLEGSLEQARDEVERMKHNRRRSGKP